MAKCNTCRHRDKRNIDFPCIDCYLPEAEHYTPIVNEWISVKDRLPEKSGYYLYFSKYPHGGLQDGIGVSYFQHKVKEWKKVYTPTVTHWMPLPEPPKGE